MLRVRMSWEWVGRSAIVKIRKGSSRPAQNSFLPSDYRRCLLIRCPEKCRLFSERPEHRKQRHNYRTRRTSGTALSDIIDKLWFNTGARGGTHLGDDQNSSGFAHAPPITPQNGRCRQSTCVKRVRSRVGRRIVTKSRLIFFRFFLSLFT